MDLRGNFATEPLCISLPDQCVYYFAVRYAVEQFCELHGYKQSTVASWVTRNRAVKTLPCDFLYCLSLSSGWSMDGVYRHLLVLEEKFLKSMDPKKKKEQVN